MPRATPPITEPALSADEFSAAVSAVTSAFGDPTRREIYLFLREREHGGTTAEVAEHFELHPNVARHHLEKLAAGGYVAVHIGQQRHAAAGPADAGHTGAGRPSKHYLVSHRAELEFPVRRDDLLITLLGRMLALVPAAAAEQVAEEVGLAYGRDLAHKMSPGDGQRSFRAALHAVADALTAHGFAAHTEARGDALAIIAEQCPFGDTAVQHPVICAVDRGMVKGMLAGLYGDTVPITESSRPRGDTICVTTLA